MKKTNIVTAVAFAMLSFSACVNITEDITVGSNGSGTYKQDIDMSSMISMMSMVSSMDTSGDKGNMAELMKMDKDTNINFSSYTDTSTSLSAEQKQLFKDGSFVMSVHPKDNVMDMKLNFPYKNSKDLAQLLNLLKQKNTMSMLMKQSGMGKGDDEGEEQNPAGGPDMLSVFNYTADDHSIEMKADDSKLATMKQDSSYGQMQMMQGMLSSYDYTTVIHLPKPAKTATGDNVTLSDDKKTVTIKAPMSTLIENPSAFAYRIEY